MNMVMNEAFIYTFLATGLATYHFTETWSIEAMGSFGFSLDNNDKRILFDKFDIRTSIIRTLYQMEAMLQYTPIYGKWQFGSGRLIYFDTFVEAGAGMTGVNWQYSDFCETPDPTLSPDAEAPPPDKVGSYPTFVGGLGQRYFVSKDLSYRWDFKYHAFMYDTMDSECSPQTLIDDGGVGVSKLHSTITIQLGLSKYF
jgi:outer membrane beta-barrel protein